MPDAQLQILFEKFMGEQMTPEEIHRLRELIRDDAHREELDQLLAKAYATPSLAVTGEHDLEQLFSDILSKAKAGEKPARIPPVHRIHFLRKTWWRAAAAILVIVIGVSAYFFFTNRKQQHAPEQLSQFGGDVKAPERTTAFITLADGSQVSVDSMNNGAWVTGDGTQINKVGDGHIAYTGSGTAVVMNTLTVPKGSKPVTITLPDGSAVWVDAGSSLTYPTAFPGTERSVEVKGQAYFEVAKDAAKKFIVTSGNLQTEVLGTHFNVDAYGDEAMIRVTLLEGSIKAYQTNNALSNVTLKPGEQAQMIFAGNKLQTIPGVNLEEVMAWKNGRFLFEGTDIQAVMRQVARWYNVEVEFTTPMNYSCVADIARDVPISDLLKIFELTGMMHFKVEGSKVIVSR